MERFFSPVKDDGRCYNVASSLERQPGIVAPTAQLKEGAHEAEIQGLSHDLTEVSVHHFLCCRLFMSPIFRPWRLWR